MSSMLKEFGKKFGIGKRLVFAFFGLFAPATMIIRVIKAFSRSVEDLSPEELQKLVEEIKDA